MVLFYPVSSTRLSKASVLKLEENREPLLILEKKNEVNQPNQQGASYTQGKPGAVNQQGHLEYSNEPGQPGHFTQHGKPQVFNQPGMSEAWLLRRNSADSNQKGNTDISNKQRNSGSVPQVGKPGTSSQQGNPVSSSPQSMSNSYHRQADRQNVDNSLKGNIKGIQVSISLSFLNYLSKKLVSRVT